MTTPFELSAKDQLAGLLGAFENRGVYESSRRWMGLGILARSLAKF